MTANPVKAPRYRPNKVVAEVESDSDAEASEDETPAPASKPLPKVNAGGITSNLSKVDLNERRKAAALQEVARIKEEAALKTKAEEGFVTESEEESEDESGSEEESSEEEESEEEAPRRMMMRPVFVKKGDRKNAVVAKDTRTEDEIAEAEEARRKALADEIVEEQIKKDVAAKAAGKKNWDDPEDDEDEVDDTDDLDPEAEYAAWKLREMKRIKREREVIEEQERELAEVERRRGLTEEERKLEDEKHIAQQKDEKESRGPVAFMQKYQHKGAFYQEEAQELGLADRNLMGAHFQDEVRNRDLLPKALQMRDQTKVGKRGATKYRDLKTEDTGQWGRFDDRGPRKGGLGGGFGADERFMPDRDRDGGGASGANSMPVAERRKRSSSRERERDGDKRRRIDPR